MRAQAHTYIVAGPTAQAVIVEVDVRPGLPAFTMVGVSEAAVRDSRERVLAAIVNCGYEFPARRITVNITPLKTRRPGPGIDLALACALLAASGQIPRSRLVTHALFGELMLDGRLRSCPDSLTVAESARARGIAALALAPEACLAAASVQGVMLVAVGDLRAAARVLADDTGPSTANTVHAALEGAIYTAVRGLPRRLQSYGREVAAATLAGKRTHGQRLPLSPDQLSADDGMRARHAVDAASDVVHTAHLQPGTRVRVRCYSDGLERDGHIKSIQPGASAPLSVEVDYPDGYRDPHGHELINPSNYSIKRIVQPHALHIADADIADLAGGGIIRARTADDELVALDGNYLAFERLTRRPDGSVLLHATAFKSSAPDVGRSMDDDPEGLVVLKMAPGADQRAVAFFARCVEHHAAGHHRRPSR
jgi:hypothetical protein